jgi:hypothetical protein
MGRRREWQGRDRHLRFSLSLFSPSYRGNSNHTPQTIQSLIPIKLWFGLFLAPSTERR